MKRKQKQEEEELKKAREDEKEVEDTVRKCKTKKAEAIESLGDDGSFLIKLANGLTSEYLVARFFVEDPKVKEQEIRMWREEKIQARKDRTNARIV